MLNEQTKETNQGKSAVGDQAATTPKATGSKNSNQNMELNMEEVVNVGSPTPGGQLAGVEITPTSSEKWVFQRSGVISRTPPGGESRSFQSPNRNTTEILAQAMEGEIPGNNERRMLSKSGATATLAQQTITRQSHIANLRKGEENELAKCKEAISKMKLAMTRQPNISKEVKTGLMRIEWALDAINFYRTGWQIAEAKERRGIDRSVQTILTPGNGSSKASQSEIEITANKAGATANEPGGKRTATSPAGSETIKKQRDQGKETPWTLVQGRKPGQTNKTPQANGDEVQKPLGNRGGKRKKRRPGLPKKRPEAVLIKVKEGQTYAEVLGDIRGKVNPEDLKTEIQSVRKTRAGDVLLELCKNPDKANLCEVLRKTLGDTATIRNLEPKVTLQFRDLDCLTTELEVKEAIRRDVKEPPEDLKVSLSRVNSREQRLAFVEMAEQQASQLLQMGRIKIGWLYCKIQRHIPVARCYRCFGYGHLAGAKCNGPDRKKDDVCVNCGEKGHHKKTCKAEPKCFLCAGNNAPPEHQNHAAGSGACQMFRQALDRKKKKNHGK